MTMKRIFLFVVLYCATVLSSARSQGYSFRDTECACKKFPYYFCAVEGGQQKLVVSCEADPDNPQDPSLHASILGPVVAVRDASPFTCITLDRPDDSPDGKWPGFGYIWNGNAWVPGMNLDDQFWPNDPTTYDIGTTFEPTPWSQSYLTDMWKNQLGAAFYQYSETFPPQQLPPCVANDTTCCVRVYFDTDAFDFVTNGYDPDSVAGFTPAIQDMTGNDCRIHCQDLRIWVNVTDEFFYGTSTIDPQNPPKELKRDLVVNGGGSGGIPLHEINVGQWYDWNSNTWDNTDVNVWSAANYDWLTFIRHEMGHILGLPHRFDRGLHGEYCGSEDKNSIMDPIPLAPTTNQVSFGSDDQCWIRKLYCPQINPGCPQSSVMNEDPRLHFSLEQSEPNPASTFAKIEFTTDLTTPITLEMTDVLGRHVATWINDRVLDAGHYNINADISKLPSGKYIYSLRAGVVVISKIMTIVR